MHFWKKLSIRAQITFGFLPLIFFMSLLSLNVMSGMDKLTAAFSSYRATVGESLAIATYSERLGSIQMAAEAYRSDPSKEVVERFKSGVGSFALDDARLARNPSLQATVATIRGQIAAYDQAFDELVTLQSRHDQLLSKVTEFGPWASDALNDVLRSAWRQNDLTLLYATTTTLQAVTKSLYFSERFVNSGDVKAYDTAQLALREAVELNAAATKLARNELQQARLFGAAQLMQNYSARLGEMRDVWNETNRIRVGEIGELGPKIATGFQALQASVAKTQQQLDNSVEQTVSSATTVALAVSAALIVIGLALSYYLGRLISSAVRAMAAKMERLAHGEDLSEFDGGDNGHELGAMARSLMVFQETKHAKTAADIAAETARLASEEQRQQQERQRVAESEAMEFAFRQISKGLDALSTGDLTARIGDVDARYCVIRDRFNNSVATLESAFDAVIQAVSIIKSGLGEISTATNDLARRTEQQASALEQTVAALSEVTRGVNGMADGASRANDAVTTTRANAENGGEIVNRAILAMNEIQSSSERIESIIGVIDEIAFQTNLLALNAGVEAARAGEAGKGFAVVAQEVRELAQRSANAAKEIKQLISTSSDQVDVGVRLVGESGSSLKQIVSHFNAMSATVTEIALSARDQALSLREVSAAGEQMDKVTQQNAAMVEQTTAAAQGLAYETDRLAALVAQFKTRSLPGTDRNTYAMAS
ncbi:methyl-accepting chemotaxis protein [Rhizobium leguminosarum bv. trifolii WSM597]|uniref:Methyl-accepting chemotaxis protein n=1 Tax=Rhizobium leguminosarum bv. trifolii WSM597 TaxID=754764 RepID=J0HCM9_RHILT|nr:methyl-accepting chemotaxis protein [Rhizobium leguminosarum]EJB08215.1 methyl-accepting chemotaxis protein [Rhizobium leguminosarum bv. trifolii WSM597]